MNAAPLFHFPALYIGFRFEISVLAFFHFRHFSFCVSWFFLLFFIAFNSAASSACLFLGFSAHERDPKQRRAHTYPKISHAKPWAAQKTSTESEIFQQIVHIFRWLIAFLMQFSEFAKKGERHALELTAARCGNTHGFSTFFTRKHIHLGPHARTHTCIWPYIYVYIFYTRCGPTDPTQHQLTFRVDITL